MHPIDPRSPYRPSLAVSVAPQVAVSGAQTRFAIIMPFLQFIKLFYFFFLFVLLPSTFFVPSLRSFAVLCSHILVCFSFLSFAISILLFFVYFIAMANPLQTAHINASLSSFYLLLLLLFLLSADH